LPETEGCAEGAQDCPDAQGPGGAESIPELVLPEAKRCTAEVEGSLEVAFQLQMEKPFCADGWGCVPLSQIVAASDGTLWVLGGISRFNLQESSISTTPWLGHFAEDGSLLGAEELSGSAIAGQLAVDDN